MFKARPVARKAAVKPDRLFGELCLAAASLLWLVYSPAAAQTPPISTLVPRGGFLTGPYDPVNGGDFQFVNDLVGGGIFYRSGFLGDSTVIGNVEAGHIWINHDVFDRSGLGLGPAVTQQISAPGVTGQFDFHATMVGHVLAGTGYVAASGTNAGGYTYLGVGMAPHAQLWSGAIATAYATGTSEIGSFSATPQSTIPVFRQFFQGISGTAADVINSSYGFGDPAATDPVSVAVDALAAANPLVTFVAAAGNDATAAVSAPGNVYNGITVGSVGGTAFRTPSAFSSRGAVDFFDPVSGTTAVGVRAAVDIAAPGEQHVLAAYLGPTGGLVPLADVTEDPSPSDLFFVNQDGTSFASPTVAGGVALMKDAARGLQLPATAPDTRVIKSVLMATATATNGWTNGLALANGVLRTTQGLDWATGAGGLNLEGAGINYTSTLGNTRDLAGAGGGGIEQTGWDFGSVALGGSTDYVFTAPFSGPTDLQVALSWFVNGSFADATDTATRSAFANLDLQVWSVADGGFASLIAESASLYNNAEFLRFSLSDGGLYGLRVLLPGMVYDAGETPLASETYGLSWNVVIVPEPAAGILLAAALGLIAGACRRRRTPRG